MAVRSAFASIFGSFPPLVYLWIGLGIFSSVLVIMSVVAPAWLELLFPLMISIPAFSVIGISEPVLIWIGYPLIAIILLSIYMLKRSL